jgi:DNA-binding NtrC family response regulator
MEASASSEPMTVTAGIERRLLSHRIRLPALKDRGEDLRALVFEQLSRCRAGSSSEPLGIDRRALNALLEHDWPGNDLELRDVIARAAAASEGPLVTLDDLTQIHFMVSERALAASDHDDSLLQLSPSTRRRRIPRRK